MADKASLTVKIDEKLKTVIETRAKSFDISLDDYVEGILRGFLDFMDVVKNSGAGLPDDQKG